MNPELDKKLVEKYPLIFRNRRNGQVLKDACWGFEHGDGWYNILDALCALLYSPYRRAVDDYENARKYEGTSMWKNSPVITAIDVERKRLAMKEAEEALPSAIQCKEKFGTLRFYADNVDERAMTLISFAESMSARTCEECGAPGTIRRTGWIRCLCDAHAEPEKS